MANLRKRVAACDLEPRRRRPPDDPNQDDSAANENRSETIENGPADTLENRPLLQKV